MKNRKKIKFKIRRNKVVDNIKNISIYTNGHEIFLQFIKQLFQLLYREHKNVYYLTSMPQFFGTWDYQNEFQSKKLNYYFIDNPYVKKFLWLKKKRIEKLLCIEFKDFNETCDFFSNYLGFFQESYLFIDSVMQFKSFIEKIKEKLIIRDFIKENTREVINLMINNFSIVCFYGQDWTHFEITSKDKKKLDDLYVKLNNNLHEREVM